ncbi:MAG: oxygen-independent coproporphyrinogen III oxidase [Candidatus Kuenenia stuttgartiensis]|nr:oxygen-independent coproporphyrinogen III oxidase [Candidatus Kuenenia stuttgartiensis]
MNTKLPDLLKKYDVPVPRYTSYPTVPAWNFRNFDVQCWNKRLLETFVAENGEVCLYIHLPFCEELCTYCACNKRITKNHSVEEPYIDTVLSEWKMYLSVLPARLRIKEIHLGGGTPTFFAPEQLERLIEGIIQAAEVSEEHEFSVEVHPNYTSHEHLKVLHDRGFNRISIGIQDFDPAVQFVINRIQNFERTKEVAEQARELGYNSINADLIYGLPKQTTESIICTLEKIAELRPDRIAFYSYAHVPWKSKGQRRYNDEDVPTGAVKLEMYSLGKKLLHGMGYISIGMDHFALPGDKLLAAYDAGSLHRNFMGYTTTSSKLLIGLGASAISDVWSAFAQNEKTVEEYQHSIHEGRHPFINGHLLEANDEMIRRHILNLMCNNETNLDESFSAEDIKAIKNRAMGLQEDGLLTYRDNKMIVTEPGKLFIRNICSVLDSYYVQPCATNRVFSKAI